MKHYKELSQEGYTSIVYHDPDDTKRVIKVLRRDQDTALYETEKKAYELLTSDHTHPSSILQYFGRDPNQPHSLILEFAENGNVHTYLWHHYTIHHKTPPAALLFRWAAQAASALAFAHARGVCHGDIHPVNCFLDGNLNLHVGDWAGASVEGSVSLSSYRHRFRVIDSEGNDVVHREGVSARTEIFAFGTAVYYFVVGMELWPELEDPEENGEIDRRVQEREFPDTRSLVLGEVISKCWNGEFSSMGEVEVAIEDERKRSVGGDV